MAILYKMQPDGGFLCGDTETGYCEYAYPTSTHAAEAKRNPEAVAAEMVAYVAPRYGTTDIGREGIARDARWMAELRS